MLTKYGLIRASFSISRIVSQNQLPAQAQQNVFGSWGDWAECSCQTRQAQRERRCLLGAVSTCRARGPLMEYQQCNPTGCAQQTAQLAHGNVHFHDNKSFAD